MKTVLLFLLCLAAFTSFGGEHSIEKFAGEWEVFVVIQGNKNFRPDYTCLFGADGVWRRIQADGKAEVQGKIVSTDGGVFLVSSTANGEAGQGKDKTVEGIPVAVVSDSVLELNNGLQPDMVMRFEKGSSHLKKGNVVGKWNLFQKDPENKNTRKAPFTVEFLENGSYVISNDPENSGTWRIEGAVLTLKNTNRQEGALWYQPRFFADGERLILNRMDAYVYGERVP